MIDQSLINHICLILNPYGVLKHLECDGLTHILHRVLSDENIEHTVYMGQVTYSVNGETIPMHKWIDIDHLRIDYRARMWLGNMPDIPHGVFYPADYVNVSYEGSPTQSNLLPHTVIQELIKPYFPIDNYV